MKTRRDFLKSLLGAALVVPAVAACQTIAPKPFQLPAATEPETMFTYSGHTRGRMSHGKTHHGSLANNLIQSRNASRRSLDFSHTPRFHPGVYQVGTYRPVDLGYNRGLVAWNNPGTMVWPNTKRYQK